MRNPRAIPTSNQDKTDNQARSPRAFASEAAEQTEYAFADELEISADIAPAPKKRFGFWRALALGTAGALVSLGLGLAAERLIRDLFAAYEWLGWTGLALLALFVTALVMLIGREIFGLWRLRTLDRLRAKAALAYTGDDLTQAKAVTGELAKLYASRSELARARQTFEQGKASILDGRELIAYAEHSFMAPLDRRAKAMTAASARRVALVTAVSPRALIDIAFITYESFRLARNLADLYGARPGFFGFMRLVSAIIAHLAVTGGLVLTDGVVEQLVGQGLATKLSARLGEGVVNGLMTVRVGIAAMRIVRPLPFNVEKSPVVGDFVADLAKLNPEKT